MFGFKHISSNSGGSVIAEIALTSPKYEFFYECILQYGEDGLYGAGFYSYEFEEAFRGALLLGVGLRMKVNDDVHRLYM